VLIEEEEQEEEGGGEGEGGGPHQFSEYDLVSKNKRAKFDEVRKLLILEISQKQFFLNMK